VRLTKQITGIFTLTVSIDMTPKRPVSNMHNG